jgi:hypothetical protein
MRTARIHVSFPRIKRSCRFRKRRLTSPDDATNGFAEESKECQAGRDEESESVC